MRDKQQPPDEGKTRGDEMNSYEERKTARLARLERAARLCRQQAMEAHESAHKMAEIIPFGQPILIGHHSEKRDRAYRARISRRFEKSFELQKKAEYYESRLAAARSNKSISSDDPDAVMLLKEKLAKMERFQEEAKKINKIIKRKSGTQEEKQKELEATFPNFKPENLVKLFEPDFCGRVGIPDYELTNNNANMRRIRKRIEQLEKSAKAETVERVFSKGVKIVNNVEENRLQMFFDGKPEESIRAMLKSNGFHWSPYNGCWQRMRGNSACWAAERVLQSMPKKEQ